MSIRMAGLAFCVALLAVAVPAQARGLEGEWRNTRNTVHLQVAPCGQTLCGTVTWAQERALGGSGKKAENLAGTRLLSNLRQRPDGTWRGTVYVPAIDGNASAKVDMVSDKLIRVSGCMVGGLVCRSQSWHRID